MVTFIFFNTCLLRNKQLILFLALSKVTAMQNDHQHYDFAIFMMFQNELWVFVACIQRDIRAEFFSFLFTSRLY